MPSIQQNHLEGVISAEKVYRGLESNFVVKQFSRSKKYHHFEAERQKVSKAESDKRNAGGLAGSDRFHDGTQVDHGRFEVKQPAHQQRIITMEEPSSIITSVRESQNTRDILLQKQCRCYRRY